MKRRVCGTVLATLTLLGLSAPAASAAPGIFQGHVVDSMLVEEPGETAYTVTFDANGGVVDALSKSVVPGRPYGELPLPSRTGWLFTGWSLQRDGGVVADALTEVAQRGDHVLYAQWETDPAARPQGGETVFYDVPAGSNYYDAVYWAVRAGITSGTSTTTFSPNDPCKTRHILRFLWRANGSPDPDPAALDASSPDGIHWKDVLWACANGLIPSEGYEGSAESGDGAATRADAVTYLWKLEGSPSAGEAALAESLDRFTDVSVWDDCAEAVAWAVNEGITNGTTGTTFSPERTCTRGQIVTFLYRCYTR